MIDSHKHITVDDVIATLKQALDEMPSAEEQVADKLLNRANELLGEISRERKLDKAEKDKEEAMKPYCSKEYIVVVADPDGTIMPGGPIEGFVFQKCLTNKYTNGPLGAEYTPFDWNLNEIDTRIDKIIEAIGVSKGHRYAYIDEYMEHGKNTTMKAWGLDRKSKYAATIVPVKVQELQRIQEEIKKAEKK